jgi:hypothetical protein
MSKPGIVSSIIGKLHKRKAKQFSKLNFAPNYQRAKSFALLWDGKTTTTEKLQIQEFIKELLADGKQVTRLVYFDVKKKEEIPLVPEANMYYLGKWDFDKTRFPKSESIKNVLRRDFDFLISFDLSGDWHYVGMAAVGKAACKIGYYQPQHLSVYDILLRQNSEKPNLNQYLCGIKDTLAKLG